MAEEQKGEQKRGEQDFRKGSGKKTKKTHL
jgi:hypothetical protein